MRFSKKLLTVLLPITAASTLVPVLTSCNKGNAWDFEYGENINCLRQPEEGKNDPTYHSLNDIKNAVKNHVGVDSTTKVSDVSVLPQWSVDFNKQLMYYDFIASCCLLQPTYFKNPQAFIFKWDLTASSNKITLTFALAGTSSGTETKYGDSISYVEGGTNEVYIKLSNGFSTKSYMFQNTTIGE